MIDTHEGPEPLKKSKSRGRRRKETVATTATAEHRSACMA